MVALMRAICRARLAPTGLARRHATTIATTEAAKAVSPMSETIPQKVFRWIDFFGYFTRWHCRKAWVLDIEPHDRIRLAFVTEYDRKLMYWMGGMMTFFFPFCAWFWWGQFTHMHHKPPQPLNLAVSFLNNRKTDFHWHGGMYQLCKDCRNMEFECKKECYDELRARGFTHRRSDMHRYPMTQAFGPA